MSKGIFDPGGSRNAHIGLERYGTSTEVQNGSKILKIIPSQILLKIPSMRRAHRQLSNDKSNGVRM
jgi:hypothetical protein